MNATLTLGIGLYDERKIAIGAYNEVGDVTILPFSLVNTML